MVERLKQEYEVDVEWRPFYLYFDTPPEGRELPEYIRQKRANGSEDRLKQLAGQHGMEFHSTERIYNTRLAHEATEFAREHGKANEFHRALFQRIYAEGQDPSQWEVLRGIAEKVGLDPDEMQAQVESEKYTKNVEEQVKLAYRIGVTGVPTYVINDRYAIVGAQPYEVFKNALAQIMKREA